MAARKPTSRSRGAGGASREWVGGTILTPFYVRDREPAYRALGIFWLDVRDGVIVGTSLVGPDEAPGQVAAVLADAMVRPMAGPPRRPDRVRVATADLADEVRNVLGDDVPIVVAPTPELQTVLDALTESIDAEAGEGGAEFVTYLASGSVEAETVGAFFLAAEQLYRLAPWNDVTDDQVIRVDIPALGVEGACLSLIGNLGESLGFLLFPSYEGFDAFLDASATAAFGGELADLGTGWLALNYVRGADLPDAVRREVAEHGWPVAAPEAYPLAERFDQDLVVAPLCERDLTIAGLVAASLCPFLSTHLDRFATDGEFVPVCESFCDEQGIEVRFCYPHDTHDEFEIPPVERSEADLTDRMIEFAIAGYGTDWWEHARAFGDLDAAEQLAVPWSLYDYEVHGEPVGKRFLEREFRELSTTERCLIEAELSSWLSVWEVTDVEPGTGLRLHDRLTGERRLVQDRPASRSLQPHDGILARVLDTEDGCFFSGIHPRALPPDDLSEMVRLSRGHLRRKGEVPSERLKGGKVGRYLIRKWEKMVQDHDLQRLAPPSLSNTDGDPLLLTSDLFHLDGDGVATEVKALLTAMDGAFVTADDDLATGFSFERPADHEGTVVGFAELRGETLRLQTNSVRRADALRKRVDAACGPLVRHVRRDTEEVTQEAMLAMLGKDAGEPTERPAELEQMELEFKQRHDADWADVPLPALQGQTPREAVRTPEGRRQVDTLLKTMTNQEAHSKGPWAFDFSSLRTELGLP